MHRASTSGDSVRASSITVRAALGDCEASRVRSVDQRKVDGRVDDDAQPADVAASREQKVERRP